VAAPVTYVLVLPCESETAAPPAPYKTASRRCSPLVHDMSNANRGRSCRDTLEGSSGLVVTPDKRKLHGTRHRWCIAAVVSHAVVGQRHELAVAAPAAVAAERRGAKTPQGRSPHRVEGGGGPGEAPRAAADQNNAPKRPAKGRHAPAAEHRGAKTPQGRSPHRVEGGGGPGEAPRAAADQKSAPKRPAEGRRAPAAPTAAAVAAEHRGAKTPQGRSPHRVEGGGGPGEAPRAAADQKSAPKRPAEGRRAPAAPTAAAVAAERRGAKTPQGRSPHRMGGGGGPGEAPRAAADQKTAPKRPAGGRHAPTGTTAAAVAAGRRGDKTPQGRSPQREGGGGGPGEAPRAAADQKTAPKRPAGGRRPPAAAAAAARHSGTRRRRSVKTRPREVP